MPGRSPVPSGTPSWVKRTGFKGPTIPVGCGGTGWATARVAERRTIELAATKRALFLIAESPRGNFAECTSVARGRRGRYLMPVEAAIRCPSRPLPGFTLAAPGPARCGLGERLAQIAPAIALARCRPAARASASGSSATAADSAGSRSRARRSRAASGRARRLRRRAPGGASISARRKSRSPLSLVAHQRAGHELRAGQQAEQRGAAVGRSPAAEELDEERRGGRRSRRAAGRRCRRRAAGRAPRRWRRAFRSTARARSRRTRLTRASRNGLSTRRAIAAPRSPNAAPARAAVISQLPRWAITKSFGRGSPSTRATSSGSSRR